MHYFATYLIYAAVLTRALGWSQDSAPIPLPVWAMLALFGLILFTERRLSHRLPWYPRLYILMQSGLVIVMLYSAPTVDIFSMLFFPLSFQAVQFFHNRIGFLCIGGFSLAMTGMFLFGLEWESGLTMILAASGANVLMGSFAYLIERTEQRRMDNQRLLGDLQETYRKLKDSAAQAEVLAAAEERYRLVRELHDSLTQTLFSMNLATQAAQLTIQESLDSAEEHLGRLQTLSRSAASEVRALTGQIPLHHPARRGLDTALKHLAAERLAQEGLQIILEVSGHRELAEHVQENLYRITQEALTNVVRHAAVLQASVRLRLESPCASLEVEDSGSGFDLDGLPPSGGFGLTGMRERARQIGWELEIHSHPGQGTRVRVSENAA